MPKNTQVPAVGDWIIVSGKHSYFEEMGVYGERLLITEIDIDHDHPVIAVDKNGNSEALSIYEFYIV